MLDAKILDAGQAPFMTGETVEVTDPRSACKGERGEVIHVAGDTVMVRLHGVGLSFGTADLALASTIDCRAHRECGDPAIATDVALLTGQCAACLAYMVAHGYASGAALQIVG